MTVTKCDVCGKEMNPTSEYGNKFRVSSYGRIWDICDNCREDLNKWLESKKLKGEQDGRNS